MSRNHLADAILIIILVAAAIVSLTWGIRAAPPEYATLGIVTLLMAALLARKILRERARGD